MQHRENDENEAKCSLATASEYSRFSAGWENLIEVSVNGKT